MKRIFKKLITLKLFIFARWQLMLTRPYSIAIIGTTNRSLVKDIITETLKKDITVQTNESQWNAELGIPLTILRTNVTNHSFIGWFITLWKAWFSIFKKGYPKVLVVEVAFNTKGDMKRMSQLLRPNAVVINDMQPLGGRFFVNERDELVNEYLEMIHQGTKHNIVILNTTLPEKERVYTATQRTVIEYSIDGNSVYNATTKNGDIVVSTPTGVNVFKTNIPGNAVKAAYVVATILKEKVV